MKYILIILSVLLYNCTSKVLSIRDVNEFSIVQFEIGSQDTFYVVSQNQLPYIKSVGKSMYIGSDSSYDYFKADKKLIYKSEVGDFAIKSGTCTINDKATFKDELILRKAHKYNARKIIVLDGSCLVMSY